MRTCAELGALPAKAGATGASEESIASTTAEPASVKASARNQICPAGVTECAATAQ